MMVDMKEGKKMSKSNQGTFFAMYTKFMPMYHHINYQGIKYH